MATLSPMWPNSQALIMGEFSTLVRWDLLADGAKSPLVWKAIARQRGPHALRMNLNTLLRHEVLNDRVMVDYVADRLADADDIRRSRQLPYQFLAAYLNASDAGDAAGEDGGDLGETLLGRQRQGDRGLVWHRKTPR